MAASMGTVIASSGAKGKRFMLPNAEYKDPPTNGWYRWRVTQQTDMAIAAEHLLKTRNTLEKSWLKIQVSQSKSPCRCRTR